MRPMLLAASLSVIAGVACAQTAAPMQGRQVAAASDPAMRPAAVATLKTASGADAGVVAAFSGPKGWLFRVEGQGWPAGWHGVHLHAVGTCEGPAFTSAGAHVNHATPHPHGLLNANGGPDLGDLQNVHADANGRVMAEVYLAETPDSVALLGGDGVAFLVHANRDDHRTQPIGGAGDRIACGVFEEPAVTGR